MYLQLPDDLEAGVKHLATVTGHDAGAVYIVGNPVDPALLGRGRAGFYRAKSTAADVDVMRRHLLFVDVDSKRPAAINASAEEIAVTMEVTHRAAGWLTEAMGFPKPLFFGTSGSGGMILYRVDLPNDAEAAEQVHHALTALASECDTERVHVDTGVFNAARIFRVPGTINAKSNTPQPDRPWTLVTGTLTKVRCLMGSISPDTLARLAASREQQPPTANIAGGGAHYDAAAFREANDDDLAAMGIHARPAKPGSNVEELDGCPYDNDHEAFRVIQPSGYVDVRCHHNRCAGKRLKDFPDLFPRSHTIKAAGDSPGIANLTVKGRPTGRASTSAERPAEGADNPPRLLIRKASENEARDVNWIWKPWLPAGMLGLFAGLGGSGKSTVALSIAAACSVRGILPDGQPAPLLDTLIFAAEDSPEHTMKPRLTALGADPDRIHIVDGIARGDDVEPGWIRFQQHIPIIEEAVCTNHIGLVIIDPISSYIGNANGEKESDVRAGIMPLVRMAERTGAAVLMIRHVSKAGDGSRAASRILGSTAWHDVPRIAWMLADAPEVHQPERREDGLRDTRRVLGVVKSNLAAKPQARWCIQSADGPLRWLPEASPVTVDECFIAPAGGDGTTSLERAEAWLTRYLQAGMRPSERAERDRKADGIAEKAYKRARQTLRIETHKIDNRWYIALPPPAKGANQGGQLSGEVQMPAFLGSGDDAPSMTPIAPESSQEGSVAPLAPLDSKMMREGKEGNRVCKGPVAFLAPERSAGLRPTGTDGNCRAGDEQDGEVFI